MIFLKIFLRGGVINKLQYGARFAGEKLLEIFKYNKKTTSSLTPTLKKLIKFKKFIFSFVTIFLKITHTLSYDRESLVTSLLVFFDFVVKYRLFCYLPLFSLKFWQNLVAIYKSAFKKDNL